MDEFEPWSMFSNTFISEESNNQLLDQDSLQSSNNLMFDIPSPVQNMQVKEEPVEPVSENVNDSNSYGPDMNDISATEVNSQYDDNAIFDFGLDATNKDSKNKSTPNDFNSLTPEDKYYQGLIKFDEAIVFICPACGKEFKAQEHWKRHLNLVHNYNTRRGLNFVQLDKLYHKCLECNKRIAMHSMENLLKHKFTHLPYRCSKCSICKRQYKYRQDLMVHIRMAHRNEMLAAVKAEHQTKPVMTIGDVKENAFDIFDNTNDNIEVKNELIDPDDMDETPQKSPINTASVLASFLDDGSSNGSGDRSLGFSGILKGADRKKDHNNFCVNTIDDINDCDDSLVEYILFLCPQCGTECETQAQWRQHIEFVHDFGTLNALNFTELQSKQAQCEECNQIISPNSLQRLQHHKFTHLPHKEWLTCKLCFASFNSAKNIEQHLSKKHHLQGEGKDTINAAATEDDSQEDFGFGGDDYDNGAGAADTKNLLSGNNDMMLSRSEGRDIFEQHICYLCPQCGREYYDKKQWRKHIVDIHQLGDLETMNYDVLNDRQLRCRECDKVITNAYGIQNAQQHRITHMKFKSFARCRLCLKAYTDRKGLIKHLRSSHRVGVRGVPLRLLSPPPTRPAFYTNLKYKNSSSKEVVRVADCTYEIHYLDEDEDEILAKYGEEFGDSEEVAAANKKLKEKNHYRCPDCGSIFTTQTALQTHIKNEHDFKETSACSTIATSSITTTSVANVNDESTVNDPDDLLIPTGEVEIKSEPATTIESNFIYLCPQCGEEFRSQVQWRRHINIQHNYDKREYLDFRPIDKFHYQCKVCKDTVQSSKLKGLQDHKFRHCPYKLYLKCTLCGQSYNHKPNMLTHLRQRHNIVEISEYTPPSSSTNATPNKGDDDYQAGPSLKVVGRKINENNPNAGAGGNRPPGLKTVEDVISFHNAVDHESITYYCPSCYKNFESHVYWRKHIVEEHNLNSREGLNFRQLDEHHYICLQCYKRVTVTHTKGAIGQLQSHKFRHLPYKSFRCTVCEGEFVRKQMFFKHLDKNTNKCAGPIAPEQANDELLNSDKANATTTDTTQQMDNEFDDDIDLSAALVQRNGVCNVSGSNTNVGGGDGASSSYEPTNRSGGSRSPWPNLRSNNCSSVAMPTPTLNEASSCFTIFCPQCGIKFDTTQTWREHINIEHNLNNRTVLNFKRINPKLHQCLECKEHVNGRKLRDLQVHKFKHLPYGAYIHCRFCTMAYYHTSNMQEHLKNKHPQMLQKILEERREAENDDNFFDGDDDVEDNSRSEYGGVTFYNDEVDTNMLEVDGEIEEVDPDAAESEEQYLLG